MGDTNYVSGSSGYGWDQAPLEEGNIEKTGSNDQIRPEIQHEIDQWQPRMEELKQRKAKLEKQIEWDKKTGVIEDDASYYDPLKGAEGELRTIEKQLTMLEEYTKQLQGPDAEFFYNQREMISKNLQEIDEQAPWLYYLEQNTAKIERLQAKLEKLLREMPSPLSGEMGEWTKKVTDTKSLLNKFLERITDQDQQKEHSELETKLETLLKQMPSPLSGEMGEWAKEIQTIRSKLEHFVDNIQAKAKENRSKFEDHLNTVGNAYSSVEDFKRAMNAVNTFIPPRYGKVYS